MSTTDRENSETC